MLTDHLNSTYSDKSKISFQSKLKHQFATNINLLQDFVDFHKKSLIILAMLLCFGCLMVFSASYIFARDTYGSSFYFVNKHILHLIFALAVSLIMIPLAPLLVRRYRDWFYGLCSGLIILTFVPGLRWVANGASRWLKIGGMFIQPGELFKIAAVPFSYYLFKNWKTFSLTQRVVRLLSLIVPLVLINRQPDFGTLVIVFLALAFCFYFSGLSKKIFWGSFFVGLLGVVALVASRPYRIKRILTFLNPWQDPRNSGFQIIQSYLALANGSVWGKGIGNSYEKLFYLPEAHNDFILSVIGEELGLVGIIFLVILYSLFFYSLLKKLLEIKVDHEFYVAFCWVFMLSIQVILNMGVVLGLLPTKGLNLPLISYGGSAILGHMIMIFSILSLTFHAHSCKDEL